MTADIVLIGEALVDVVHRPDAVARHPGGSPANVALALGRRGLRPVLVTQLADDDDGRLVRDWLAASGVAVAVPVAGERTSTAVAHLDADGAATYDFDIAWMPGPLHPPAAPILHSGSIATTLGPGADEVERALRAARQRTAITFDPNVRPSLIGDGHGDEVRARVERIAGIADVVKASGEDLDWLRPGVPHVEAAAGWLRGGASLVVVTEGGDGAFALHASGVVRVPAEPVPVIDTVGAGDTFMAALLAGLHAPTAVGVRERIAALSPPSLDRLLRAAAAAAAVTVSRPGADPPWAHELAE